MQAIKNDFYVVLKSNASPITQPNNTSTRFINDYQNPIELDTSLRWKVALTEFSYRYDPASLSDNAKVTYEYIDNIHYYYRNWDKFVIKISEVTGKPHLTPLKEAVQAHLTTTLDQDHKLIIKSKYRIIVQWWKDEDAEFLGMKKCNQGTQENDGHYYIRSGNAIKAEKTERIIHFYLILWTHELKMQTFRFPYEMRFENISDMLKYIKEKCSHIFFDIGLQENSNKVYFMMQKNVYSVFFDGDLNYTLGFQRKKYNALNFVSYVGKEEQRDKSVFNSFYLPRLYRDVQNMHIYANICKPMHVGHNSVPLLKNIFDNSIENMTTHIGFRRTLTQLQQPMYVDVGTTSIDHIEISICNELDEENMDITENSITTITLHFKCEEKKLL